MKIKTSVTLSAHLLQELDQVVDADSNRSRLIEEALRLLLKQKLKKLREEKDISILNQKAERLNREAEDVLSYQVEL